MIIFHRLIFQWPHHPWYNYCSTFFNNFRAMFISILQTFRKRSPRSFKRSVKSDITFSEIFHSVTRDDRQKILHGRFSKTFGAPSLQVNCDDSRTHTELFVVGSRFISIHKAKSRHSEPSNRPSSTAYLKVAWE